MTDFFPPFFMYYLSLHKIPISDMKYKYPFSKMNGKYTEYIFYPPTFFLNVGNKKLNEFGKDFRKYNSL